jgi:hypothetical protein
MPRKRTVAVVAAAATCLLCCVPLFSCAWQPSDDAPWTGPAYSLKSIGRALRLYHESHGHLPPAVVRDNDGRPLYSWRVLLLPYLEDDDRFAGFRADEPWDSPRNRPLAETTPGCYLPYFMYAPRVVPGMTRFQALVGPGTAFERDGLTWEDFLDGRGSTLLVVEGDPVPWSKPADVEYDPARPLPRLEGAYAKPARLLCLKVWDRPGFNAVFADGTTMFIRRSTDERVLRALITRNGGEAVDMARLE